MIRRSVIEQIGSTPLIELGRLYPGPGRIFGKAEFLQPGGSVKDRAALQIIQDAYQMGTLKKGQPVVEMTSGNMGAGLAVACAVMGNPFFAVMSEGNSPERLKMLRGFGAEVVLVPQVDGSPGKVTGADVKRATEVAVHLSQEKGAFYADQFNNPSSTLAHERTTGPEIWADLKNEISAFVAAVGSGGTFVGTSRFLKRQKRDIFCAAVEPEGAEVLNGKVVTKPKHLIQGTGYGAVPPHWEPSLADEILAVSDEEASAYKDLLGSKEGLFVGYSAAANVAAAVKLLASGKLPKGATVVTILCDTGLKY